MATDIDVSVSNAHACQADSLEGASNHVPRIVDLLTRVQEKLRRDGLKEALTKVLRFITLGWRHYVPNFKRSVATRPGARSQRGSIRP